MPDAWGLARVGQVGGEIGVEDQAGGGALVQRIGDLGRRLARVERHGDGADALAGEQRLDEGEAVAHEQAYALSRRDAGGCHPAGHPGGAGLEVAVGERALLARQRLLSWMRRRGGGKHRVDRTRALAKAAQDAAEMRLAPEIDGLLVLPVHARSLDALLTGPACCGDPPGVLADRPPAAT